MPVAMENGSTFVRSELLQSYQMKLATLKSNNSVLSFCDELKKIHHAAFAYPIKNESYHCKAEDLYFHYQ